MWLLHVQVNTLYLQCENSWHQTSIEILVIGECILDNMSKVRPLFTLSLRGSDNSPLLCSSELIMNFVVCILHHDFDQSNSLFQTQCGIFKMMLVTFSCNHGHVVYSDQKVKASQIPSDA